LATAVVLLALLACSYDGAFDLGAARVVLGGAAALMLVGAAAAARHQPSEVWSGQADTGSAGFARDPDLEFRAVAARLGLVLKTAAEGILGLDDEQRVVFATPAAAAILGWTSAQEMHGKSIHEVTGHRFADGSLCAGVGCRITGAIDSGDTVRIMDEFFTRRDGAVIPVEYVVSPLTVSEEIVGAVVAFHDISERKALEGENAEARVQAQEQSMFLDALLEHVPLPIFYKDADCRYLGCNRAFEDFFGAPRAALIGKSVYDIAPSENARKYDEADHELMRRGGTQVYEWNVTRPNGENRRVIFHKAVFMRPNNAIGGIVGSLVDITELLATEQELLRSNAELEEFAYVVSHDLRQPLRMITSYLELLGRQLEGTLNADQQVFFGFAIDGAKRLDALTLGLLEYSRVGKAGEPTLVPLDQVVAEAIANLAVAIDEAGAEMVVAHGLPAVMGNRVEMMRLFQNLVGNAVKYRSPARAPRVEVGSRDAGAEWVLWVKDNGIGIADDDRDRAFKVFQRLVHADTCEGTGIGLAVCKKIAERAGGRIWIESEVGNGSTFFVALPKTRS
jgi:PAS domain S-box-containing protein